VSVEVSDREALELAIIENVQRTDLNAIEEARGYQRLLGEFSLTHQEIAEAVGKDRSTITNLLRVLALPDAVQRSVESGELSAGHARALAGLQNEIAVQLANDVIARGLSVRQTEHRARLSRDVSEPKREDNRRKPRVNQATPASRRLEDQLRRYLQTDVHVELSADVKGVLRISFYSAEDLDRLKDLILPDGISDFA